MIAPPPALVLHVTTSERGWIGASVSGGPAGGAVTIREGDTTLATLTAPATKQHLVPWTCDRQRTFTATAGDSSTTATATTPSCATRLSLKRVTPHPRVGTPVKLVLRDRFGVGGIRARVCLDKACAHPRLVAGRAVAHVTLQPSVSGPLTLRLDAPGEHLRRRVNVGLRPAHTLLTTGDSEIQVLQDYLAAKVAPRGVRTVKDDHISTSLGNPTLLDWPAHAKGISAAVHPDVTIMFMGANEGFNFGRAACCDNPAWVSAYAKRVRGLMRSFVRGGRGHLYYILLPPTEKSSFARVFRAVNKGIIRAAKSYPRDVTVVDIRHEFPLGSEREADGVHLDAHDDAILAGTLYSQMRHDGVI